MLACMYIPLRATQLLQGSLSATDGARIELRMRATKGALWARIKHLFDGSPDWFDEVVSQCSLVYQALHTNKAIMTVSTLRRALDMWKLLRLYTEDGITTAPVTCSRGTIKDAMRWLQHQLDLQDISYLMRIPPGKLMEPYDTTIGIAPTEGRTKAPGVITAKDLVSLMLNEWVTDSAVDGYMALLCHSRNGHFHEQTELQASPEWHA